MPWSGPRPVVEKESPGPVLVLFSIDGSGLDDPVLLRPDRIHQVVARAKVDDWPSSAEALEVDLIGTLSPEMFDAGRLEIAPPDLEASSWLTIKGDLDPKAPPIRYVVKSRYRMEDGSYKSAAVVGHPDIRFKTFDSATALPRSLPTMALRLQEMIAELDQRIPHLAPADRNACFTLLESLCRYASLNVQQSLLKGLERVREDAFQADLKRHFVADPEIGARIWEGKRSGGGITDLGLESVVLELKVSEKPIGVDDAGGFLGQPAHYAAGGDRQVSILCILDDSPKEAPPGVLANGWVGTYRSCTD